MGALLMLGLDAHAFEFKASQTWILHQSDSTSDYNLSHRIWEWKSTLSPQIGAHILMDQTELWAKDTLAGLRSLNLQWLSQNAKIQTQAGPWQGQLKYEGSPTADLSYNWSQGQIQLGSTGPGQLRLHSQSTLGEERYFSWTPVDYFAQIHWQTPKWDWNYRAQMDAYEISPKPWEFKRKAWSHQTQAKVQLGPWQIQTQASLGQIELSSMYQGFLWAKLDQSRWAQAQAELSWQSKSWQIQGAWIWGHAQMGNDSFIEPYPLSPISALDALKWRWQQTQATLSAPWIGLQWHSQAPIFNVQLGSQIYAAQRLQFDGIFKTRTSTSPPFFTYKSQDLDGKSPYSLWQKLNAEFSFTHSKSQFQVHLGQWIPWLPTQENTPNSGTSPVNKDAHAHTWGGLEIEIRWQGPLP